MKVLYILRLHVLIVGLIVLVGIVGVVGVLIIFRFIVGIFFFSSVSVDVDVLEELFHAAEVL